jgi:putative transposase
VTDAANATLTPQVGTRAACAALGAAQAGYYRRHRASPAPERRAPVAHRDRVQPRALSSAEGHAILDMLHQPRFVDLAPAEVWATLLDEGTYLGRCPRSTGCCAPPGRAGNAGPKRSTRRQ